MKLRVGFVVAIISKGIIKLYVIRIKKMKKIRLPIHSFVDVITNSSTVIYVQCHDKTIELAKELINEILEAGDVNKTADDLFEFKLVPNENTLDLMIDRAYDDICANIKDYFSKEYKKLFKEARQSSTLFSDKEIHEKLTRYLIKEKKEDINKIIDIKDCAIEDLELLIVSKTKNSKQLNLSLLFQRIFNVVEGGYC